MLELILILGRLPGLALMFELLEVFPLCDYNLAQGNDFCKMENYTN